MFTTGSEEAGRAMAPARSTPRRIEAMLRWTGRALPASVLAMAAPAAGAHQFYSIDYTADELVLVDDATGAVVSVGPLGRDVFDIDLAILDGVLYGSDSHDFFSVPYADLLVIDRATGAVTSSVRATFEGGDVYAEGLAAAAGQLWIAFDPGVPHSSDQLGLLDPATGVITGAIDYSPFGADMDALGADLAGTQYALDADSSLQSSQLFRVSPGPVGYAQIGGPCGGAGNAMGMHDIAFTGDGAYTIDSYSNRVHHIDPASGALLGSVFLTPSVALLGLELDCSQTAISYCTAGISAGGCQAVMSSNGTASATASAGFALMAADVEGAKDGLFFFGTHGRQANPWGNGTSYQCVVPPVKRTPLLPGGGTNAACDGSFDYDLNAHWTAKPAHNPGPGSVVQAQLWYRDPQSTSNQSTSLSDALEFLVCQ
jgi:hypothetical protein